MKKILVTGGTVFVSRYTAEYFANKGYEVYVLNRNTRPQSKGVRLVESDRHSLGDKLKNTRFDAVLDITAYTPDDISSLLAALGGFDQYIMVSSSAVYPETAASPFTEDTALGENKIWGAYGTNKIAAELYLLSHVPAAYILRPPYLYGEMNNLYREAFVFDCAMRGRDFYLPNDGEMELQFLHVQDLCGIIEKILVEKPQRHIYNVGNKDAVTVKQWAELCYRAVGKVPTFKYVHSGTNQREYFCFYDYEYFLDVSGQYEIYSSVVPLDIGLRRSFEWYRANMDKVNKKPYIAYIDKHLR